MSEVSLDGLEATEDSVSMFLYKQLGLMCQSLENERLEMSDETRRDIECFERVMEFYG